MEDVYLDSSGRRYFDQGLRPITLNFTGAITTGIDVPFSLGLLGKRYVYMRIPSFIFTANASAFLTSGANKLPDIFRPTNSSRSIIPYTIAGVGTSSGTILIANDGTVTFAILSGGAYTVFSSGTEYNSIITSVWYDRSE